MTGMSNTQDSKSVGIMEVGSYEVFQGLREVEVVFIRGLE